MDKNIKNTPLHNDDQISRSQSIQQWHQCQLEWQSYPGIKNGSLNSWRILPQFLPTELILGLTESYHGLWLCTDIKHTGNFVP